MGQPTEVKVWSSVKVINVQVEWNKCLFCVRTNTAEIAHTRVRVGTRSDTHTHTHTHTHTYIVHTHAHTYTHAHTHAHKTRHCLEWSPFRNELQTHAHPSHMRAHTYTRTHVHTHTHTHTHTISLAKRALNDINWSSEKYRLRESQVRGFIRHS